MTTTKVQTIGFVVKPGLNQDLAFWQSILDTLHQQRMRTVCELDCPLLAAIATALDTAAFGDAVDLILVIGGDGTMLRAVRQYEVYCPIFIGINAGNLGFLTDIRFDDFYASLDAIVAGAFTVEQRSVIQTEIVRDQHAIEHNLALNDVVLDKGASGRIVEFELHIDGEFVCLLRADGVIIATATGSTAYALSAGGPLIHPAQSALVVVPLSPHTLSNRPIVLPDSAVIELVITRGEDCQIHVDGQTRYKAAADDRLRVYRHKRPVHIGHPMGYSYYATLRQKLQWQAR